MKLLTILTLLLTQAGALTGVRVRGSLKGFPTGAPAGLIRVAISLASPAGGILKTTQETTVASDGTFEFVRVTPGAYDLSLRPIPAATMRIDVQNRDIDSLILDAGLVVSGKVVFDGGSFLPRRSILFGNVDAFTLVRIDAQPVNTSARAGSIVTPVRGSDGVFLMVLPEGGEYRIGAVRLPLSYSVQSLVLGSMDLLQSPLTVSKDFPSSPAEIRVTLTSTPPVTGPARQKITGRVFGIPPGLAADYMVIVENSVAGKPAVAGTSVQRLGEVQIREDGTFEVSNVPPDAYSLSVGDSRQGMPSETVAVVVGESEVRSVELMAPAARPSGPAVPPPVSTELVALSQSLPLPSTQPAGVRVAGNVTLADVNERTLMPQTIALFGTKSSARSFQTSVSAAGAFEFPNVPPGEYEIRTLPLALPDESTSVLVGMQEVKDLRVALPARSNVDGRVRMDDGSSLPDLNGMIVRLASPGVEIDIPVGTNGGFAARLAHGDYTVSVRNAPREYTVAARTIHIGAPLTEAIQIGLRRNP